MGKRKDILSRFSRKGKGISRDDPSTAPAVPPAVPPSLPPAPTENDAASSVVDPTPSQTAEPGPGHTTSTEFPTESGTTHSHLVFPLSADAVARREPEHLWDEAYELLRADEPELIARYEAIVLQQLGGSEGTENVMPVNREEWRQQMDRLLAAGLEKTAKLAKMAGSDVRGAIDIVLSVKGVVGNALQAVPVAAAAWAGVCVVLQVFLNPITEITINREDIIKVVRKMKWYSSLSKLLLGDRTSEKDEHSAELCLRLADQIVELYKTLLRYITKSICVYYRHSAQTILRDALKLDDWSGSLADVVKAEDNFKATAHQFGVRQANTYLEILVSMRLSRTQDEILQKCCVTDMTAEIESLQSRKDQLYADSYKWILDNQEYKDFTNWQCSSPKRLMWIKGDAGKGKTMLVIGIVRELTYQLETHFDISNLSYFFCQGTNNKLNTATSIVRGFIWMLLRQERSLIRHLDTKFRELGSKLFDDSNAFYNLKRILGSMLEDPALKRAYLIVDALDECRRDEPGLPQLLQLISEFSDAHANVKWLVSSRNEPEIEAGLAKCASGTRLSLELNADSVAKAVEAYIGHKMSVLIERYRQMYEGGPRKTQDRLREVQDSIANEVRLKASGTFLWVALVFKQIERYDAKKALDRVRQIPSGLDEIYTQMISHIVSLDDDDAQQCKSVLLTMAVAYGPLRVSELASLAALDELARPEVIVRRCGLLTIKENDGTVFFVHQSAKDFLVRDTRPDLIAKIFPRGLAAGHWAIASRSLEAMPTILRRNIYDLDYPGCNINYVIPPGDNPLLRIQYSCVYWLDHFCEADNESDREAALSDNGAIYTFFKEHFLYWIESLSLLRALPRAILSIGELLRLVQSAVYPQLTCFLEDAERFTVRYRSIMERAPLQVYAAALVFCPTQTEIKRLYWDRDRLPFIKSAVGIREFWDPCRQILEPHNSSINAVAFSPDGKTIASASYDGIVRLWDTTGEYRVTLERHKGGVRAVAFSPDGKTIVSVSNDSTVRLWDTTGVYRMTFEGHNRLINAVAFSPDGKTIASASYGKTVRLCDTTGAYRVTLEGHNGWVRAVAFSPDGKTIASASSDGTVRLWDTTGAYRVTLEGHNGGVNAVAFSPDGKTIASGSNDNTVKLWDITGVPLITLERYNDCVNTVTFSPDGKTIASGSDDMTVRLWDTTGAYRMTLRGHGGSVNTVTFSPDGKTIASASSDNTVRLWDVSTRVSQKTLEGHNISVKAVTFSTDGKKIAAIHNDDNVRLWDVSTGTYQKTLKGHDDCVAVTFSSDSKTIALLFSHAYITLWDVSTGTYQKTLGGHDWITGMTFSPDGKTIASASDDNIVELWDVPTGTCRKTLQGHNNDVDDLTFSPDSKTIALVSSYDDITLWDVSTGTHQKTLEGHVGRVTGVTFSPDGKTIASASDDKTVRLWDVTGVGHKTLYVNQALYDLSFSKDGRYLKTDKGELSISSTSGVVNIDHKASDDRPFLGLAGDWVTRDGRNLLWLPYEYRSRCMAVHDDVLVLGHKSGGVTIFQLA